ncbi:MAG TPA: DUF2510 domain-containing protein [Rhodoglobus sp.]|nr:DUF2510 domain-containing protein [Rhodoglobus sp.]
MTTAAPGWYPDPSGSGAQRWWDGAQWTERTSAPYSGQPLQAPSGTRTSTPFIWLIIVLPLIVYIPLFFVDWGGMVAGAASSDPYRSAYATYAVLLSPGYLITMVLAFVVYALTVFFAYRDHRALEAAGVPRPFHWAFAFIQSYVYPIGRSVVVKRRTGSDGGTLAASIVALVLIFVLAIALVIVMLSQMFAAMAPLMLR